MEETPGVRTRGPRNIAAGLLLRLKIHRLLPAILLCAGNALAQTHRVEMYAGYSFLNAFSSGARHHFSGAQGSLSINANDRFGVAIDAGGQYRPDPRPSRPLIHAYELLGGPQFTKRGSRNNLSAHVLFGVVHGLARGRRENFAAAGLGGAMDFHRGGRFAVRVQADYVPNRGERLYHDVRLSIGGVLRIHAITR